MEDFNISGPERVAVLERLPKPIIGLAPKHFWAACQIQDIKALDELVELAHKYPAQAYILAGQTQTRVLQSIKPTTTIKTTTPVKRPSGLSSFLADSPSAKRQKTTASPIDM